MTTFEGGPEVIVVLPSLSYSNEQLAVTKGLGYYDERMLWTLDLLRQPDRRVVFCCSRQPDNALIEYYLSLLPAPTDARARLTFVVADDNSATPLSVKIIERPEVIASIASAIGGGDACLLPWQLSELEWQIADALNLAVYGAQPSQANDRKSDGRRLAVSAGLRVVPGREDIRSMQDLTAALNELTSDGHGPAFVVKLNGGFAGNGNAVLTLSPTTPGEPVSESGVLRAHASFPSSAPDWDSYANAIAMDGAAVEVLLERPPVLDAMGRACITPGGDVTGFGTYEIAVGGPTGQHYLGCSSPAPAPLASWLESETTKMAKHLVDNGVIGHVGVDFLVDPARGEDGVFFCELNLRMGASTHPLGFAVLATGGVWDAESNSILVDSRPMTYVGSDHVYAESGRFTALELLARLRTSDLLYDRDRGDGVVPYLLGPAQEYGRIGLVGVGRSAQDACAAYESAKNAVDGTGPVFTPAG